MRAAVLAVTAFATLTLTFPSAKASPLSMVDALGNSTDSSFAPGPYNLDCASYPNVCENWCYYVFCHKGGRDSNDAHWTVTVSRNAALRGQSECGKYAHNKCSVNAHGDPWPSNPTRGLSCDEQPKNTNAEGGPDAATRCMPAGENSGEGAKWSNYINKGSGGAISDGTQIRVALQHTSGPNCASYRRAGSTSCPAPEQPNSPDVASDAVRQQ
ncbi:hypothetical protein PsYK624_151530 [Phanerochaete sordida]|uniref:Deoxyribonuclease NucA/NucB domain-containing protein n=1 Tax=Phanerochaete sordida TaxID=48140 RepID=A0A9P3GPQ9_9APHY|nr:hypothetical protein PsYK624_151530 [Phanerochaete sordida]